MTPFLFFSTAFLRCLYVHIPCSQLSGEGDSRKKSVKRLKRENNVVAAAAVSASTALPSGIVAMKPMEVTPAGGVVTLCSWPNAAAVYAVDVESSVDVARNIGVESSVLVGSSAGAMDITDENGSSAGNSCGSDGGDNLFQNVGVSGTCGGSSHMGINSASSSSSSSGDGGDGSSSDTDAMRMKKGIKQPSPLLPPQQAPSQLLISEPPLPQLPPPHSQLPQQQQQQQQQQQRQLPQHMFVPPPLSTVVTHMYTMRPQ